MSLWIWTGCAFLFITTAIHMAPPEKLTFVNVVPFAVLNLAFFAFVLRTAVRVRQGNSIAAAMLLVSIYGILFLVATAILLAGQFTVEASLPLLVTMIVLALGYVNALVSTARVFLMACEKGTV
jgi:hypothetical protein